MTGDSQPNCFVLAGCSIEEVRDSYNEYCSDVDCVQNTDSWQAAKNVEVPFPADFELTEDMIGWAKEKNSGLDEQRIQHSTKKFEYYQKDNKNKDWFKKWQLWIMDENPKFSNSPGKSEKSQTEIYAGINERYKGITD